jgi:hypothetical protein
MLSHGLTAIKSIINLNFELLCLTYLTSTKADSSDHRPAEEVGKEGGHNQFNTNWTAAVLDRAKFSDHCPSEEVGKQSRCHERQVRRGRCHEINQLVVDVVANFSALGCAFVHAPPLLLQLQRTESHPQQMQQLFTVFFNIFKHL